MPPLRQTTTLAVAALCWAAALSGLGCLPSAVAESRNYTIADTTITTPLTLTTSMAPRGSNSKGGKGSGFINQHLKLLTMLTLAVYLKVDHVILPTATSRDSWEIAEPTWRSQTANSLWDVGSIAKFLAQYNITLREGTDEDDPPPGAVMLPSYFCRVVEVGFLEREIDRHVHMHLARLPERPTGVVPLTLYAPELILSLRTDRLPLYAAVGRAVHFAKPLERMADILVGKLQGLGSHFNGLHLRVEGDFREVHNMTLMQGLESYGAAIRQLNFSNSPLYIASAIFVEGGAVDVDRYHEVDLWLKVLMAQGHTNLVANGRLLVHNDTALHDEFVTLHSEQRAALDFLVLIRARKLVGTRMSSFSFGLRECRALQLTPRNTTGIVGETWSLFQWAASFAVDEMSAE